MLAHMKRPKRKIAALQTRRFVALASCIAFFLIITAISATTKFQTASPVAQPSNTSAPLPAGSDQGSTNTSNADSSISDEETPTTSGSQPETTQQEVKRILPVVQAVLTSQPQQTTATTQKPPATTQPHYEDDDHEEDEEDEEDEHEYEMDDD